jgi:outer membrane protein insertion porin family
VDLNWSTDSSFVEIFIHIEEGEPTIVDTVIFEEADQRMMTEFYKQMKIKEGQTLDFETLSLCEDKILRYLGNKGFLSATISRGITLKDNRAEIVFKIDTGIQYKLGETYINGNTRTKTWFIQELLGIEKGDILTLDAIDNYRKNIYKQGLFKSVDIDTKPTPVMNIIDLSVDLVEKRAGELSLGGGYGSEEEFRLSGHVGYINLFGRATGISVKGHLSVKIRLFEIKYLEPHFFGSKIFFETNGSARYIIESDFEREQHEGIIRFGKHLIPSLRMSIGYDYRKTILHNVIPQYDIELNGISSSEFFTEMTFDNRDQTVFSRRGVYSDSRISVSEPYLIGDVGFLKLSQDIRFYHLLAKSLKVSFQGKVESLYRLEDKTIPVEELFFLGGSKSIRGYERNSLGPQTTDGYPAGGKFYYFFRSELAVKIWKPIWIKFFHDNGGLYRHFETANFKGSNTGVGTGIQLLFGIWTARLEYAWQVEADKIYPGMFHFDLGSSF